MSRWRNRKSGGLSGTGWAFVTSHSGLRIFLDDFLFNNEDNKKYLTFTIFTL